MMFDFEDFEDEVRRSHDEGMVNMVVRLDKLRHFVTMLSKRLDSERIMGGRNRLLEKLQAEGKTIKDPLVSMNEALIEENAAYRARVRFLEARETQKAEELIEARSQVSKLLAILERASAPAYVLAGPNDKALADQIRSMKHGDRG